MKHGKLTLIVLLGGILSVGGCSSNNSGGAGAGGSAGEGGSGGLGGQGGSGGEEAPACAPTPECGNADIGNAEETCEPALPTPPDSTGACTGQESLEPPETCERTGSLVIHQLTRLAILPDCNVGYDLDGCDGSSCELGSPAAPGEGMNGIDNGLAGLQERLGETGDLTDVNQAFYDAICDGSLDIKLVVDANVNDNCATVDLFVSGKLIPASYLMNLSDPVDGEVCASGTLGTIPFEVGGQPGFLSNTLLRVTIVPNSGFSNGELGGTLDSETAANLAEAISPGAGSIITEFLDITDALEGDTSMACDALSLTLDIGGVVINPEQPMP